MVPKSGQIRRANWILTPYQTPSINSVSQLYATQRPGCVTLPMSLSPLLSCCLGGKSFRPVHYPWRAVSVISCRVNHVVVQTRLAVYLGLDVPPFLRIRAFAQYALERGKGSLYGPPVVVPWFLSPLPLAFPLLPARKVCKHAFCILVHMFKISKISESYLCMACIRWHFRQSQCGWGSEDRYCDRRSICGSSQYCRRRRPLLPPRLQMWLVCRLCRICKNLPYTSSSDCGETPHLSSVTSTAQFFSVLAPIPTCGFMNMHLASHCRIYTKDEKLV